MTYLDFRNRIRRDIWTAGEPRSKVVAHNNMFVDALIEIQKFVECFQQNNTQLTPHCATHYLCGMTAFDVGRGRPKQLSVVEKKINDATGEVSSGVLLADSSQTLSGVTYSSWAGIGLTCQTITPEILAMFDWEQANTSNPPFWKFTFTTRKIANTATVQLNFTSCGQALTARVQASNDNYSWTTLHTEVLDSWTELDVFTFEFANTGAYIHYRVTLVPETISEPVLSIGMSQVTLSGDTTPTSTSYTDEYDWCGEIEYTQVEPCYIRNYLAGSAACGSCLPIGLFFGLPSECLGGKGVVPVPTDEGLPAGLPVLPLGYHYPQESTNATRRATRGVWAIERGKVFIAPWIQSTEMVVMRWDGIKRSWADADLVDEDPDLMRAVKLYVQKESARDDDHDYEAEQTYERQFNLALQGLWHECRQETRVRECEPSHARGTSPSAATALYYNDQQQYTASCPSGQNGTPVTVTIPAGTVGSAVSVADANALAYAQAQSQAMARLVCEPVSVVFWNTVQSYTATCEHEDGAPVPDGAPVTVRIEAHTHSSTVSQEAADALALAEATRQAEAGLSCVWYNREVTVEKECPEDDEGPFSYTVNAAAHHSELSQRDADHKAEVEAENEVNDLLKSGCGSHPPTVCNHAFTANFACTRTVFNLHSGWSTCSVTVFVAIPANYRCLSEGAGNPNELVLNDARMFAEAFVARISPTYPCVPTYHLSLPPIS